MGPTSNSPPLPSAPFEPLGSVEVTPALAPVFVISVGDPQKVGSTLNVAAQHTVYTVRTRVRFPPSRSCADKMADDISRIPETRVLGPSSLQSFPVAV